MDSQKEGFESQKDAIQGNIDAKQAEIDKINEAIKVRKDELDLQEAQYDLARKQNQKPKLMYSSDKGLHYVQDTSGIRDAKEKILENKNNKTIASIEKEIDALEAAIDAVDRQIEALDKQADAIEEQADAASDYFDTLMEESDDYYDRLIEDTEAYWDSLINGLEEYQTRWEELADLEEEAKMNAALKELNITTEDILNMSEEDFESFKQRYLAILTEIYAGNEEVQAALQEASGISVESLQSLIEELRNTKFATDEYSESADNAKTGSSEWSVELDNTSTSADEATASVNNLTESTNSLTASADNATVSAGNLNTELSNPPSTEGYDAVADALSRIKSVADAVSESVRNAIEKVNTLFQMKEPVNLGANLATNVANKVVTGKAYASGTKASGLEHDEENALRSEHGQKELAVYPDGTTELTESPVMSDLPKGTVVYNEEQTEKILDNKAVPVGKAFAKGTGDGIVITPDGRELRPLQPGDEEYEMQQKFLNYFTSIDGNLEKMVPNSTYERNMQMHEIINQINNSSVVNNRNVQQPVNQVFNITMPNVTDATTATELMNDLQSLSRKKFQVDWDK